MRRNQEAVVHSELQQQLQAVQTRYMELRKTQDALGLELINARVPKCEAPEADVATSMQALLTELSTEETRLRVAEVRIETSRVAEAAVQQSMCAPIQEHWAFSSEVEQQQAELHTATEACTRLKADCTRAEKEQSDLESLLQQLRLRYTDAEARLEVLEARSRLAEGAMKSEVINIRVD